MSAFAGALAVRAIAAYNVSRFMHLRVRGERFLPSRGPALIAARHYHHLLDGAALLHGLPRQPHLFVALDWTTSFRQRYFMRRAIADGAALLARGRTLAIFPEAYPTIDPVRSRKSNDAEVLPFRGGMLSIVALAGRMGAGPVPIVPAGLSYARRAAKYDVTLRLGAPLWMDGSRTRSELLRELRARVMELSR